MTRVSFAVLIVLAACGNGDSLFAPELRATMNGESWAPVAAVATGNDVLDGVPVKQVTLSAEKLECGDFPAYWSKSGKDAVTAIVGWRAGETTTFTGRANDMSLLFFSPEALSGGSGIAKVVEAPARGGVGRVWFDVHDVRTMGETFEVIGWIDVVVCAE